MKRRFNLFHLDKGIKVIDDTYSSNPHSAKAAIDVLVESISYHKRVVVLGSMLNLGKYSVQGHTEVGKYIAKKKIDLLFTVGSKAKLIGDGAINSGFPSTCVKHFSSKKKLHAVLRHKLEANSTILVKGSNKLRMNQTVRFIRNVFKKSKRKKANETTKGR